MAFYYMFERTTIYTREPGMANRRARRERGIVGTFPSQDGAQAAGQGELDAAEFNNLRTTGEAVTFRFTVLETEADDRMPIRVIHLIEDPDGERHNIMM